MWLVFLFFFTVPVMGAPRVQENPIQAADRAFNAADYDTARNLYERALRIVTQESQKGRVCELMNNLAAVAMAQRQDKSFRHWVSQARACQAQLPVVVRQLDPGNLLQNGGFEQGLAPPWGTGHYEDKTGKTAFGLWWNSLNAQAYMKIDTDIRHSGERALRVTNASRRAPHVFTTTSQRITGLRPNTVYRVSLWAKAQDLAPGAVSFAVDAAWVKRLLSLPPGTYDWQPFSATINLGHSHYIDLRLIHQNTGTVWLDDLVVVEETGEPTDFGGLLQRAESLRDNAHLAEALSLYQRLSHSQPDHLLARYGAGRVRLALGRYPEALEDFQWLADRKFREAPLALGDLYQQLGEFERAQDYYQQALKAVEGDQGTYSLVLDRLAANALSRGDVRDAQRAQQQALRILRHIDDKHGQAVALHTLGGISVRLGDQTAAELSFREALRIARRIEDQRLIADVLVGLADLEIQRGARRQAGRDLEEALAIQKTIGDARGQIAALHLRARLRRQAGARQAALEDWRAATILLSELYTRLGSIPQKTRAAFLGQFDALYRDYLDLLLELYQERPRPRLLEEALQTGEKARSRRFTEMMNETRAAAILGESGDPAFTARLRKEREAQLALEALLERRALLERMPAGQRNVTPMAELAAEQRRVEAALRQAAIDLARTYPRYEDLRNPQPLHVAELQALLDSDEALLAYFVTAGYTGIFAFTPQQVRLVVVSIGREELLARTAEIREAMPAVAEAIDNAAAVGAEGIMTAMKRYDPAEAYQLYRLLVAPVAEILDPARRVYLAPDDLLYRLPFETLLTQPPDADPQAPDLATMAYWVRRQALSYLPSLSVLYSLRHFPKPSGQDRLPLVAFADPVFETGANATRDPHQEEQRVRRGNLLRRLQQRGVLSDARLPRLPETAEEARTAAQVLGAAEQDLYLRERATEYNVKHQPLSRYRYLLFATHGFLAGEFGDRVQPGLALSFVGDPQNDGLLEMVEILGLNLHADLVTLSACNTGRGGGDDRGEGFAGLTRSFMYAGAESLAVTLWSVESLSAQQLAEAFYRGLPHGSRAQALAKAKREFIRNAYSIDLDKQHQVSSAHPFFWAPFILVGEGR